MSRKLTAIGLLTLFLGYLMHCTSMRYLTRDEFSSNALKKTVWITLTDGTQYKMTDPRIQDAKLIGQVEGQGNQEIDLAQIELIGIKEVQTGKTIALGAIGVLGGILIISALSGGGETEGG